MFLLLFILAPLLKTIRKGLFQLMKDKKIFITGATSGIGMEIAQLCIDEGYEVHATGRNKTSLKALQDLGAHTYVCDLNQKESIRSLCQELPEVDVVILNAGVGVFKNAYDLSVQEINQMIDINIRAPIYFSHYLAPQMIENKSGHIIFIGSQAGKVATKKASVYAASKHAITGFANGLRMELASYNVKVSVVFPGPINTPFLDKADPTQNYKKTMKSFLLKPETVANKVIRLIEKPKREVNLPRIMSFTSKLYAVTPSIVEILGKSFFNKK